MKMHMRRDVATMSVVVALVCLVLFSAGISLSGAKATLQLATDTLGYSMVNSVAQWQPESGYPGVANYPTYGSWEQMLPPAGH